MYIVVGASSGVGLELVKILSKKYSDWNIQN